MTNYESSPTSSITAVDVFSGCGGMTTGLKAARFQVVAGVEINEAARQAYQTNHPGVPLFGDVRELLPENLMATLQLGVGDLDLLAGCSPCQGFSRMRTRNRGEAAEDERNDLVLEFARLAEGLLPKVILFENVPGLMNDHRYTLLTARLTTKGYVLDPKIVNMAAFGIPQRRRRLIILGSRLGEIHVPEAPHRKATVRDTIEMLPSPTTSKDPVHHSVAQHSAAVLERIKRIPKNGGSRTSLGIDAQLRCHQQFNGYKDVYGRMAWDKPAPTITRYSINPSKGRYLHPEQDREITLREAALLQTFPPDYQFPLEEYGRFEVASMIGEALPPAFAEYLARQIVNHLRAHRDEEL